MGKGNNTAQAVTLAGTTVTVAKVAVPCIALVPGTVPNFRGARAAWYAALVAHVGQPATAYLAHCAATPPSLPTKGKNAGVAEKPQGWLAWFVSHKYCTLV